MNGTWWAITVISCIVACAGTCILLFKMGYADGYDAGRDYEKTRQAQRRLRETREQAAAPRRGPDGGYPPWYVTVAPRRAAPLLEGPTVPFSPVSVPRPRPTDTGEIRAITAVSDQWISRMQARETAWRARTFS